jgi:HlyD family secretion protein
LTSAKARRDEAEAAIKVNQADVEVLQAVLADLVLISPRTGRVQYRLARAGEVIAAGQRVLTILDLNDVYMTIYLPAAVAGKLALGAEARTILDPIPEYVLPNTISFVATEAQFTPKSVETAEEREKLMFRVKLQGDPQVLAKYHREVMTGVRGLGFVRTDRKIAWPPELVVKLPQ